MRTKTSRLLQSVLFSICAGLLTTNTWAQDKVTPAEAQKIAKEAYIFNYPLVMMYRTMYLQAIDAKSKSYSGGFGKWLHLGTSSPKDYLLSGQVAWQGQGEQLAARTGRTFLADPSNLRTGQIHPGWKLEVA